MIFMNRRGDIATTSLLIIALILIIVAWTSFLSASTNFGDISSNISMSLSQIEFNQQYITSETELVASQTISSGVDDSQLKDKFMEIAATHSFGISQEGNLFAKIRNGDFSFTQSSDIYTLQISGVNVAAQDSELQIRRYFDITMKFDKSGQRLA